MSLCFYSLEHLRAMKHAVLKNASVSLMEAKLFVFYAELVKPLSLAGEKTIDSFAFIT